MQINVPFDIATYVLWSYEIHFVHYKQPVFYQFILKSIKVFFKMKSKKPSVCEFAENVIFHSNDT